MKGFLRGLLGPVIAAVLAMVIGGIVVAAMQFNPLTVYGSLIAGAFGNLTNIGYTLTIAVPLVICGLGIALAFQAGLFNIGADGQYWVGAIAAVWCGYHFTTLPGWLHVIVCLLAGMLAGGLWGGIVPGLTKAFVGAHEVITTMMMSYIGVLFAKYLIEGGPMQAKGSNPQSPLIVQNAWLPVLIPGTQLTIALIIALVLAVFVWWLLKRTTLGFQLRAVGLNLRAARYAGMRVKWLIVLALTLSGILSGLAGGVQMLAADHRLLDGFTSQYGYTAIVVSLLARNHPLGVILSAIFFAALSTGGQNVQMVSGVPASLTDVLTGLIVFFVAAERLIPQVITWVRRRRRTKPQEDTQAPLERPLA
jgi:ABC-type uncharacterized transport system permease subunit